MKVTERLALIERLANELADRYEYDDIRHFLDAFELRPYDDDFRSETAFAKSGLVRANDGQLAAIVDDLGLSAIAPTLSDLPKNWKKTSSLKLFISHISKDKDKATRLKGALAKYAIDGFVAHEDVHPTLEWQLELERALFTMDALVAVLTPGFRESNWAQQEVGIAIGRGVKVISFKMGEDPTGFISKHQALGRGGKTAEEIAVEIDKLLSEDERTAAKMASARFHALDDEIPF